MNISLYVIAGIFILVAACAVVWAVGQANDVATVWLTVLIVVGAILQLVVMLRQTSILARQDEILAHRANLTCFAQTGEAPGLTATQTGLSIRIAMLNQGTRGATAFHLYVRTFGALDYYPRPNKWVSLDNNLYHRTIQTPLFAGDAMWIKAFVVCYPKPGRKQGLEYRVAFEDGATDWLPLSPTSIVPNEFKALLETMQDTED